MPDEPIVAIIKEVRSFYAAGKKSGNKVYTTSKAEYISDNDWNAHKQQWSVRMMASNLFGNRNKNQALSAANRPAPPNGQSLYQWGRGIYNGGARAQFTSGNCGEMAVVAACIAIDDYHYLRNWVYLGCIGDPGDHVFCLLSMAVPNWNNAAAMTGAAGTSGAYVIDPWLNTVCSAEEYWGKAQAKVAEWGQQGKRIWWKGVYGNSPGWYNPSASYAAAFGAAPLNFISV